MNENIPATDFWSTTKRGMLCRCPKCGKGALYKSYLKQVDTCAECGEALAEFRADDGPAWLTILIAGHLMVPFITAMVKHPDWPQGIAATIMLIMLLGFILMLLPRTKGFFIAMLWRNKQTG